MKKLKIILTLLLSMMLSLCVVACGGGDDGSGDGGSGDGGSSTPPTELSSEEIYAIAEDSVGEIVTYKKSGGSLSLGTAFLISSDGKMLTNYHVIDGGYSAKVTLGETTYDVKKVLAYDKDIDLAVVKIDGTFTPLTMVKDGVAGGMKVYAVGSSEGYTLSFSSGVVASPSRTFDGVEYIQHEAAISHGNSGGPLFNAYGKVIGINTSTDVSGQNLNFAISCKEVDNLTYGTALTVKEFFEKECDPFSKMKNYAITKGEYDAEDKQYTVDIGKTVNDGYTYSRTLYYEVESGELQLALFMSDGSSAYMVFLDIDEIDGVYGWSWIDKNANYMSGTIYASTWETNSLLGISYYNFSSYLVTNSRKLASLMMSYMLTCVEGDLSAIGVVPSDLGFKYF